MDTTHRLSPLHAYVLGVVGFGGAAFWAAYVGLLGESGPVAPSILDVLAFIVVGIGLELAGHKLAAGNAKGSLTFVLLLGAGLVFGPMWGGLVAVASVAAAQLLSRKPPIKIAFNAAQYCLAVTLGCAVYLNLGGQLQPRSAGPTVLPFLGFVLSFFFVNSSAVAGAVALSERQPFADVWIRNTLSLAAYDFVTSGLGLGIALLYTQVGTWAVLAVVVPILFMQHIYGVNVQLQATNRELLDLMVKAIEARDPYTSGHSQRVSHLASSLARSLRIGFKEVENIGTAALLHDVGKIYEEFAPLLRKEGRLTPEERALMQSHPVRSAELVGTISSLHGYVYKCVRHHHENFDGSGYPDGLVGDQIPVGARIIMVADTVDAMTTDRPYRKALSFERVVEELAKYAGRQFDPEVVAAFHRSPVIKRLIETRVLQTVGFRERTPERSATLAVH